MAPARMMSLDIRPPQRASPTLNARTPHTLGATRGTPSHKAKVPAEDKYLEWRDISHALGMDSITLVMEGEVSLWMETRHAKAEEGYLRAGLGLDTVWRMV